MAVSDDSINPPPPSVALKDNWASESLLHIEAKNRNSLIIVRDPDRQIIGADVGTFKRSSPIGVCYIEARVAGNQLYTHIINDPSRETSLELQNIATHSAVPEYNELQNELQQEWPPQNVKVGTGGLLVLLRPWEREDLALLWPKEGEFEPLLKLFPSPNRLDSPPQNAILCNQRNAQEDKSPYEPNEVRSFTWHNLKPGIYEVEFLLPPLGKRRIPVLIESGYMTLICAHQIAGGPNLSQGVICLWPFQNLWPGTNSSTPITHTSQAQLGTDQNGIQSHEIERLLTSACQTEVALDALYVRQIGVNSEEKANLAKGEFEEPIRALATGYARLLPFVAWFDAYSRGERDASRLLPEDARETLNNVVTLGRALFKHLPHSVDARLLSVAGLWFLKALEAQLDQAKPNNTPEIKQNEQKDPLHFGARKRERARWLYVPAAIIGVATLISLIHTFHLSNTTRNDSALRLSVLITIMCGVITAAFYYVASRPAKHFTDPPMFSVGMDILLRLSALSKEVCRADSRITDTALRLTTDSLWTRWDSTISPKNARSHFEETLNFLTAELGMNGETSGAAQNKSAQKFLIKAAKRMALALRYPLSFIAAALAKSKTVDLQRIASIPEPQFASLVKHIKAAMAEAPARQQQRTQFSDPGLPMILRLRMIFHLFKNTFRLIWNFRVTKNFTLASLLVVVAVIAILAAILFPVFAQAREKARRTSCISNNKQVGLAILQYVQDYDEQFPSGRTVKANSSIAHSLPAGVGWAGQTFPYWKNAQMLSCPDDPTVPTVSDKSLYPVSYSYNYNLAKDVNQASLNGPASTILLSEVQGNLANVVMQDELPSGVPISYSSAGDGINVLLWSDNGLIDNNKTVQYAGGIPGGFECDGTLPTLPSTLTCGRGFSATTPMGRHGGEGGTYMLSDGHAKFSRGNRVSAGGNATTSRDAQAATTGAAPQTYRAAGTSGLGKFSFTYSIK